MSASASAGGVGVVRCQCGTVNSITNTNCELCDNILLSPQNSSGECFRVGQPVWFERLNSNLPEKGIVVRFITSKKTGELLVQVKYADKLFSSDVYDELHCIDKLGYQDLGVRGVRSHIAAAEAIAPSPQQQRIRISAVPDFYDSDSAVTSSSSALSSAVTPTIMQPNSTPAASKSTPAPKKRDTQEAVAVATAAVTESNVDFTVTKQKGKRKSSEPATVRKDSTENRDLCALCGEGGEIICCDRCPRALHTRCLLTVFPSATIPNPENESEWWNCPFCTKSLNAFCLSDIDLESKEPYKYINLFNVLKKPGSTVITLGNFLHFVEIVVVDPQIIHALAEVVSSLAAVAVSSGIDEQALFCVPLYPYSKEFVLGETITMQYITESLQSALGADNYLSLLEDSVNGGRVLGNGLKPSLADSKLLCRCGKNRLFRTFCYSCGVLLRINPGLYRHPIMFEDDKHSSSPLTAEECEGAAVRALQQIHNIGVDSRSFENFGGDILFLLRNVVVYSSGAVRKEAIKYFLEHLAQWLRNFNKLSKNELEERQDFEYSIEMLQVLRKFKDICDNFNSETSSSLEFTRSVRSNAAVEAQESDRAAEVELINTIQDILVKIVVNDGKPVLEDDDASDEIVEVDEEGVSSTQSDSDSLLTLLKKFNMMKVIHSIQYHYRSMDVSEVLGFDPYKGRIPLTDNKHCGHCGHSWTRSNPTGPGNGHSHALTNGSTGKQLCPNCSFGVISTIDYGCMIDALVKLYVAQDAGVRTTFNGGADVSLSSVFQYLPIVRSYQPIDALGHNFYKLQCYFITHFIYVFSDWGHHRLRREIFAEEFNFIVANLRQVIRLQDSEIVGEFLQCLCILQYSPETDPCIVPLFNAGKRFLIRAESKLGKCGLWATFNAPLRERLSSSARIYDKYHSSYCASIGLIDYMFAGDRNAVTSNIEIREDLFESISDQNALYVEEEEPSAVSAKSPKSKVKTEKSTDPNIIVKAHPGMRIHVGWETFAEWVPFNELPYSDDSYYLEAIYGRWVDDKHHRIRVHFPDISQVFEMNNEWVTKYGFWEESIPDGRIKLTKTLYKETMLSYPKPNNPTKPKYNPLNEAGAGPKKKQKTSESAVLVRPAVTPSPLNLPKNLPVPNIYRFILGDK